MLTNAFQGSLAILLFFTLEESLYPRSYITPKSDGSSASTLDTSAVKNEKSQVRTKDGSSSTDSPPSEISDIKMKSYWETHPLHVWGTNPKQTWRDLFFRPYLLARFPPVLWAGMFTGVATCWWAAMFTTQSGTFHIYIYIYHDEISDYEIQNSSRGRINGTVRRSDLPTPQL